MRLHIHWFKLLKDDPKYDWGGIICRRREWKCRFCPTRHTQMSGSMPV